LSTRSKARRMIWAALDYCFWFSCSFIRFWA